MTRGTLDHVGPAQVVAASRLVRRGQVISLNRALDEPGRFGRPSLSRRARALNSLRPLAGGRFALVNDDVVEFALQAASHWDALSHVGLVGGATDGVYHGGAGLEETAAGDRAATLGIDLMAPGLFTRGILLDLVAAAGREAEGYLPSSTRVGRDQVEACLAREGLSLQPGDAVLAFTGFERRMAVEVEAEAVPAADAGLDGSTLPLWEEARISALAADNLAVEPIPIDYSIHTGALRGLGLPLGELWRLEEVATACRDDGVYEFLLVSVPLYLPGAFGSPANAIAVR